MKRFESRIELIVEHYAEDKEAAFNQQIILAAIAAEGLRDGVMCPVVKQGHHMLYSPPVYDDIDASDITSDR